MAMLGKILVKLMPKKMLNKFMGKALKKAPKVDCGIFAQAANKKVSNNYLKEFFENASGHTEVSLTDVIKQQKSLGVEYGKDFVRKQQNILGSLQNKLHKKVEFGDVINKKDFLC